MIYVVLLVVGILFFWFIGKMSKPACALTGLVGTVIMGGGAMMGSLSTILFGSGLFGFSVVVFMLYNGENW